jgi:hypothetical protein
MPDSERSPSLLTAESTAIVAAAPAATNARDEEPFQERLEDIHRRMDRVFMAVLLWQWLGCVAVCLWSSRLSENGLSGDVSPGAWKALFLGGSISVFAISIAILLPGAALTRHTMAKGELCRRNSVETRSGRGLGRIISTSAHIPC